MFVIRLQEAHWRSPRSSALKCGSKEMKRMPAIVELYPLFIWCLNKNQLDIFWFYDQIFIPLKFWVVSHRIPWPRLAKLTNYWEIESFNKYFIVQLIVLMIYSNYSYHLHGLLYSAQRNIFFTFPDDAVDQWKLGIKSITVAQGLSGIVYSTPNMLLRDNFKGMPSWELCTWHLKYLTWRML